MPVVGKILHLKFLTGNIFYQFCYFYMNEKKTVLGSIFLRQQNKYSFVYKTIEVTT